jgi:hypothetical protein
MLVQFRMPKRLKGSERMKINKEERRRKRVV